MISINLKTKMTPTQKILLKRHLNNNGEAQRFFTNEIRRLSDPYVPKDSGTLKNDVEVGVNTLTYAQIYSRYQWAGKVMAGNPRRATSKNLRYNGAPKRGKEWTLRMWADRGNEIVKSVATFVGGVAK